MKHTIARILVTASAAGGVLFAGVASAIDWNVTGFVRQEIAYSISSSGNPNNTMSNPFNGRINHNITHAGFGTGANATANTSIFTDANGNVGGVFSGGFAGAGTAGTRGFSAVGNIPAGANTSSPVDCHFGLQRSLASGTANGFGRRHLVNGDNGVMFPGVLCPNGNGTFAGSATNTQGGQDADLAFIPAGEAFEASRKTDDIDFNVFNSRLEVDVQAKISKEFSAYMKFRAYYDATRHFTDGTIGSHFNNTNQNQGSHFIGSSRASYTELANGGDYMLDIPALYLDWNRGPLWIRFGNQTIAWGEAYFFRTMDVANGLDLRRHLTLGPGAEEYQDQRIASPGIRVSYTFDNGWELDAFAQLFSPTILPGQNTPYNLIAASGGRLDDSDGLDDAKGSINYGLRMTMPLTDAFTGILAYVNRRNPDGLFVSTDAPTSHAGLVNTGCLNGFNDTANVLGSLIFGDNGNINTTNANLAGFGNGVAPFPTLNRNARHSQNGCGSAFAPDPLGTPSLQYWDAISKSRLNNGHYINQVVDEFPAAKWAVRDIFGFGNEENFADTYRTLEGFRSSFGPFIQWFGRRFERENIFMMGGNYIVTMDDPNSLLDQLIIRGEVAVTPNKAITNDLSFDYTKVDDIVSALIFEKYHRMSDAFPATYIVMQWMHRTATDLFGRNLDNNDTPGIDTFIDPVTGSFTDAAFSTTADDPRGTSSANYVVFAFQQPFPNLIWRFDFAVLVDVAGGYLIQPGLRYRPAAKWQWDLYATVIESPGGNNDTITESLDFADEVFLRLTYFF
jgi:hypothetical protein